MDRILQEKFKSSTDFFENAIAKNKLFHSYLLTGNNNIAKYAFALNIARILNCTGDKSEECNCLNCKWIKSNSHPAIMTFSPIDFVHVNDNGKAKDNISVKQARFIKEELSKTSTYHRVLIITNAATGNEVETEYDELRKYSIKAPVLAGEDNSEERIWVPRSLKPNIFSTDTANTLLKTIEEPFDNVTFFFLANSTEDLIPTIVSRCQCVNIPSSLSLNKSYEIIEKIIKNYPPKNTLTAIMLAEHIQTLSKEHELPLTKIIELIQDFYMENIENYIKNSVEYRDTVIFLNKLEHAKKQLNRYVNPDSVLENIFF